MRLMIAFVWLAASATAATAEVAQPEAFLFAQGFAGGADRPFADDLDGDGFAELVCANGAGEIWVCRNERGQRAHGPERWAQGFARVEEEPVAAGDFDGNGRLDLAAIRRDGRIVLARPTAPEGRFDVTVTAAIAPASGDVPLYAADADGDKIDDLFAVCGDDVFLIPSNGRGGFEAARKVARPAWLDAAGRRTDIPADPRLPVPEGGAAALGDIDGDGIADLVVFTRRDRCDVRVALARPAGWYDGAPPGSKDTDGDGLLDFEELVYFRTDPLVRDTDHDGLLDGWEAKGTFRGVRLDLMGANPRHKDIFLELDVEQGADMNRVKVAIERMEKLYRAAPVENPDGRSGIEIHCAVDTRVPRWPKPGSPSGSAGRGGDDGSGGPAPGRQELRELFFTPGRAGIFHWMLLGAEGGGGQADFLADHGACAGVYEATLPHEFGHQLGLNHGGGDGMNGIPHYPSLMNYAYNYQLGGRGDAIDYSRGALAHLALDENALPERLAVTASALAYLAGPPFHFKVEPREGGAATWIDWDRDGVEDEKPVRANINAASGEGYGPRDLIDKLAPLGGGKTTRTREQPALVAVPAREGRPESLVLLYVPRDGGGGLAMRVLDQNDWTKWGPEIRHPTAPADLHDLSAAPAVGGLGVEVFGTSGGGIVRLGPVWDPEKRAWVFSPLGVRSYPSWRGVPAVCADGGFRPIVVLRRLDGTLSACAVDDDERQVEIEGVKSSVPAALAIDTVKREVLMATSDPTTDRMRLTRLDPETFRVISTEPVGGEKGGDATNQRAAIAFGAAPWLPPEGEIDIYVAGKYDLAGKDPNNCTHLYRCYTIGDKSWLGRAGWKCDMTWNEWTYTLAPPAAAWFHGRPWHASPYFTIPVWDPQGLKDTLCIGPNADGICDSGLRDWNDWEIITAVGLERSILHTWTPRGRR